LPDLTRLAVDWIRSPVACLRVKGLLWGAVADVGGDVFARVVVAQALGVHWGDLCGEADAVHPHVA
jgi:hypothetical protein